MGENVAYGILPLIAVVRATRAARAGCAARMSLLHLGQSGVAVVPSALSAAQKDVS